ncbi:MAG: DoxX family protein [Bacteroidetes bacterium]|nr:DoxX family protein [Bacteroidota bacterium]
MGLFHQSYRTGENVPKWIFILRIVVGLSLVFKAYTFFTRPEILSNAFANSGFLNATDFLIPLVPWVNLIGGILITVGLFTRLASLVQIPLMFGAVLFVNLKDTATADLPFSFLILVLVVVFSFIGGGYLSLDESYRKPLATAE